MFDGAGGISEEGEDHSSPMSNQIQGEIFQKKRQKQMLSDPLGEGGEGCAWVWGDLAATGSSCLFCLFPKPSLPWEDSHRIAWMQ